MNKSNASTLRFLKQFFGASNKFDLDKIERSSGSHTKIRPWVELLTQSEPQPTVLPCWRPTDNPKDNHVDWYGIAFSPKQLRRLSEELMAFVGPTYSTYRGQTAQLNLEDPIEAAIDEFTQGNAIKFNGDSRFIWQGLERMRLLQARSVKYSREIPRPTGRVLRDFYMALQAGARNIAEQELQYLANQHRLDALNLLFLRVQLLAELQQWNELLTLPEIGNLLQVKRPFAVTQALLKAVYQVELLQFEEKNTPSSAVAYFQEFIFPRYQNLFAVRAGSRLPEVLKLFMLLAVSIEPKKPALRDELLAIEIEETHRSYLHRLAGFLPDITPPSEEDPLQQAEKLAKKGDFDQLFIVLRDVPPSKDKVSLLFQGAYELQTLEAEKTALQAFDELTIEEQTAFLKLRWNQDCLNRLRGSTEEVTNTQLAETIPASWLEWLSQLNKQPTWERALFGILRSLVKDLKLEEAFSWLFDKEIVEQESEVDVFQKLNGKSVLIYTLTETAALRVKSILEAASKVKVNISHDKGGTDRLGQWVKNSDIVLMVTASAKHAATNFIEAHRPPHLAPILLVNSKGSASMLRIIKEYLTKT